MSESRIPYVHDFLLGLGGVHMDLALIDEASGTTDSKSG